ncbi:hypothetical protein [Caballeronia telluris]|uniref:hypothetical protein n=1 Tax=Caballeronia telluris TaxID=326475 RepID=UPI000B2D8967|nr:hypothetical protein [Caballeronia telluris]
MTQSSMTQQYVLDPHALTRRMGCAGVPANEGRTELVSHMGGQVEEAGWNR